MDEVGDNALLLLPFLGLSDLLTVLSPLPDTSERGVVVEDVGGGDEEGVGVLAVCAPLVSPSGQLLLLAVVSALGLEVSLSVSVVFLKRLLGETDLVDSSACPDGLSDLRFRFSDAWFLLLRLFTLS